MEFLYKKKIDLMSYATFFFIYIYTSIDIIADMKFILFIFPVSYKPAYLDLILANSYLRKTD